MGTRPRRHRASSGAWLGSQLQRQPWVAPCERTTLCAHSGEALLAVTPKETVVSYFTAPESRKDTHPRLRAVGCILQASGRCTVRFATV